VPDSDREGEAPARKRRRVETDTSTTSAIKKTSCCGKHFPKQRNLEDHGRAKHDHPKLVCPVRSCGKEFIWYSGIYDHKARDHNWKTSFMCPELGCNAKQFSCKQGLENHDRAWHNHPKLVCPVEGCGKEFTCTSTVSSHKARDHNGSYTCPEPSCNAKQFGSKRGLEDHGRARHGYPKLSCPVQGCGKEYASAKGHSLHKAMDQKTPNRPFTCTEPGCQKKFLRPGDLREHRQTRHGRA